MDLAMAMESRRGRERERAGRKEKIGSVYSLEKWRSWGRRKKKVSSIKAGRDRNWRKKKTLK